MVSMRSTTSSGVGTQTTSLPCWPMWGLQSCCWACAMHDAARLAAANADAKPAEIVRNMSSFPLRILQRFGGVVGEARALAALQGDVPGVRPALHAVHDVGQPRAAFGEIGGVDLRDVA